MPPLTDGFTVTDVEPRHLAQVLASVTVTSTAVVTRRGLQGRFEILGLHTLLWGTYIISPPEAFNEA